MEISEGLLSRSVNSSYTLARLTVTLGTEPPQPDVKLRAFISLCVLTLIRRLSVSRSHGRRFDSQRRPQ